MDILDLYQPLVEAREAPLYHWVGERKLPGVLEDDFFYPDWEHILPEGNRKVYGTSMSRNPKFDYTDSGKIVRFTFDQGLLSRTNKIIPLDAEVVYDHTHGSGGTDPMVQRDRAKINPARVMAEEFVMGKITPAHKYITEILLTETEPELMQMVQEYSQKYGIPIVNT